MKLFYFPLKARAETARLVMKLGGKEFEDVIFSFEEWGKKYKALSPSGQAPWLELDDGRVLSQSMAIAIYCAGEAGMLPSDPFQVARTMELMNCLEEVSSTVASTGGIKDLDEKIAARKALCEPDGAVAKKMQNVEALVAACTTPFYCGEQATVADIHLFTFLSFIHTGFLDGITKEFTESFEKVSALRSKVASMPKVVEIYSGVDAFGP